MVRSGPALSAITAPGAGGLWTPSPRVAGEMSLFEGHHKGIGERIEQIGRDAETVRGPVRRHDLDVVDRLRSGLADLRAYAEVHFAQEEKLMEDVLYPQRAHHVERHRAYLSWMSRLDAMSLEAPHRLHASGPAVMLAGWWEAHAHGQDRALTEFLCRGGV